VLPKPSQRAALEALSLAVGAPAALERGGWASTSEVAALLGTKPTNAWARMNVLVSIGAAESRRMFGRRHDRRQWRLAMSRDAR
jgi:hypothetical protein